MPKMIFVNLPVTDVDRSAAFYEAIGATRDERFCQAGSAAMLMFSDTISLMVLSHARFSDFTSKRIIDARTDCEVLICLSEDSRDAVDQTLAKAVAAGARPDPAPAQDLGFMYGRSFEDPDGHSIELTWMDVDAAMAAMAGGDEPVDA
ncbi:MAG: VOC family protein [Sphingomonas sp.]